MRVISALIMFVVTSFCFTERASAVPDFFETFRNHQAVMLLINPKDGQIVKANSAAAQFYGYPVSKLENMSIQDINQLTPQQVAIERKLAQKSNRNFFIFRHKIADGTIKTVEVQSNPFKFEGQTLLYSIVHDISEKRAIQDNLWHYKNRLEEMVDEQANNLQEQNHVIILILLVGLVIAGGLAVMLFLNASKLRNTSAQVETEKRQLSEIIWGTNVGTWEWNVRSRTAIINDRFVEMLGYTLEDFEVFSYEQLEMLCHPSDFESMMADLNRHFKKETETYESEFRMRHKAGHWVWIQAKGKVVEWTDHGRAVRISGTHTDITYRKHIEKELKVARQDAIQANLAKSIFLANMSHELRTPMMGIRGILDLLRENDIVTYQVGSLLNDLDDSSKSLMALLDDILDLSKIESGRLVIDKDVWEPAKIVQSIVNVFNVVASKKGIMLESNARDYIGRFYEIDDIRFRQILTNLISNAVKFTEEGSIHISMAIKEGKPEDQLYITVEDTGIGMRDEEQKYIFDRFKQADGGRSRKFGGTGLGLAISHELTQLFGGKLHVESILGKGTKFTLMLPLTAANATSAENKDIKLPNMNILLAEDNAINQKVVSAMLSQRGHKVEVASNGKQAVEKAENKSYDVILMDMHMPEMDGLEATRLIRAESPANNNSPIIAFTADAIQEHQKKFMEAGVDGVITKPIMFERLSKKIADILETSGR